MNTFIDTSVFQGITQYKDESRNEWQRHNDELVWSFYKLIGDIWIFQGKLAKRGIKSKGLAYIHEAFLRAECPCEWEE